MSRRRPTTSSTSCGKSSVEASVLGGESADWPRFAEGLLSLGADLLRRKLQEAQRESGEMWRVESRMTPLSLSLSFLSLRPKKRSKAPGATARAKQRSEPKHRISLSGQLPVDHAAQATRRIFNWCFRLETRNGR